MAGPGDNANTNLIRGLKGEDSVVEVPPGTVATDLRTGKVICDVDREGARYLLQVRIVEIFPVFSLVIVSCFLNLVSWTC